MTFLADPGARRTRVASRALIGAAAIEVIPALHSLIPLHRPRVLPSLCGVTDAAQIALTFDDGPDTHSTPHLLDVLAAHRVSATFFLLGGHVLEHGAVVRRAIDEGHDLGIHGWDHWPTVGKGPAQLRRELTRTLNTIEDLVGVRPTWYRPPFGVLSTGSLLAARHLGLRPVLWSAWGGDWSRRATVESVARRIRRDARPGGTALLHDTDRASARDSWRITRDATDVLLHRWGAEGIAVGSLATHGLGPLR